MARMLVAVLFVLSLFAPSAAFAQTGDGSLRGYVKDEQGGVLPGVTLTARGEQLLAPVVAVTDAAGYYRLNNLPPGTFSVTAELTGFATYRREGILMRAGSTFSVDVEMKVGALSETVTVAGESPMIETQKPTSVLTITGDLVRAAPVTSRRLFSDVLDMAPGVSSRNVDDGVGRRAYYFHGTVLFGHVFQLEGAPASSFLDASAHSMGMGGDTIADTELKLGGVDAASPMGTGIVMNIVAPRGGNAFKGATNYDFQPRAWNSDNTIGGSNPGGIPTVQSVKQVDMSLGGPIVKDKAWFFGSFRYADLTNGISRSPLNLANLNAFKPGFQPFDNGVKSKQPFVKVTAQLSPKHEVSGFYQRDRLVYTSARELDTNIYSYNSTGGGLAQGKLTSVWNNRLTSSVSAAYNNKSGNDEKTYAGVNLSGPQITVHQDIFISGGVPTGNSGSVGNGLVIENTPQSIAISPNYMLVFRGDLTYFKEGWGGSHEFKAGVFAQPRLHRDTVTHYVNDGYVLQELRQIDPSNPAAGTTPFHQRYRSPADQPTILERDRDIGVYVQDSWKPHQRVTTNLGLRVDFVHRRSDLLDFDTEKSTEIQPRVGIAYLVTSDARNVMRASYSRLSEQVNGRDYIVTFGNTGSLTTTDVYFDKTGKQTTVITPPTTSVAPSLLYAPDLHQPWVDEVVVGFRKQFPGQFSVDFGATRRIYHDNWGQVDINGKYPSGPNQAFGGFGLVDPNQGIIYQERNNTWTQVVVTDLEGTVAKNMSHNFQMVLSLTRQWQHLNGTFNPTDPAAFIQPSAFPNNGDLSTQLFGNGDHNTLDGRGRESGAAYRPFSVRLASQYFAPFKVSIGASYVIQAGGYVGPVVTRLASADPLFGPGTVTLANGTTQPNPLATAIRFANATRGDGQARNDTARYLQVHIGRIFKHGVQELEPALNIFNVFNTGAYTQWNTGANQLYSPAYLSVFNRHPPRAFQITAAYRF
jgi:hypothetical protein